MGGDKFPAVKNYPPIKSYFDHGYMEAERRGMFDRGVRYVGHTLMAPATNDYVVPPTLQDRYIMFNRGGGEYDLISNVCLHRQAQLLYGRGNAKRIMCRLHCWNYTNDGTLKTTPHFTGTRPADGLARRPLSQWNGMLFDGRAPDFDLKAEGLDELLSLEGYTYTGSETTVFNYNWKTFSEIYLDDYHVFAIHPGLRRYIDLDDLGWSVGRDYTVQWAGMTKNIDRAGSKAFEPWHAALKRHFPEKLPRYAALWVYIYPNIMIERYPHVTIVSTVYPTAPQQCVNHMDYFYRSDVIEQDPSFVDAAKLWLDEVAAEDADACRQQEQGRAALLAHGHDEGGPPDPMLEKGVDEFYSFLQPIYEGLDR